MGGGTVCGKNELPCSSPAESGGAGFGWTGVPGLTVETTPMASAAGPRVGGSMPPTGGDATKAGAREVTTKGGGVSR